MSFFKKRFFDLIAFLRFNLFSRSSGVSDGKISKEELKELSAELPVLKKLYFDFYGEFIDFNLDEVMVSTYEAMHSLEDLTSSKLTVKEKKLFNTLLTDPKVRDVALLIARGAASIDSLHKREETKYNHWAKVWGI